MVSATKSAIRKVKTGNCFHRSFISRTTSRTTFPAKLRAQSRLSSRLKCIHESYDVPQGTVWLKLPVHSAHKRAYFLGAVLLGKMAQRVRITRSGDHVAQRIGIARSGANVSQRAGVAGAERVLCAECGRGRQAHHDGREEETKQNFHGTLHCADLRLRLA